MARTTKKFTQRATITVSFWDGSEESFSVPLCLVGNLAPVVASQYRGGRVAVTTKTECVHSRLDCGSFADRLRTFIADISKTFGRSWTTGGCGVCGHADLTSSNRINFLNTRGAAVS